MKAFALVAPANFGWAELPDDPPPGPGEVAVHPAACGICASDVHYWLHGRIGDQVIRSYPFALGHECAGVVVAVGEGVANVAVGQRVAVEPGITCGECRHCKEGRENICPNVKFLATPPIQGALRETILTTHRNVEPLPDSLSFEDGALCEPFGVGIHAVRLGGVRPGETVAVFGGGSIGLSAATAAKCKGAERIIVAEPIPERRRLAESMGFEAIDISADPVERVREMTGAGVDIAFEAAGDARAMNWTCAAARIGGRAVIIGIPVEDIIPLDLHRMRRSELTLFNCRRSNRTLETAIRLMAGPAANIRKLATHRFPVSEAPAAFEMVSKRTAGVVKAMLSLD